MNFASSPPPGTTAVASGLLSSTFDYVYDTRACQLFAKRLFTSTL